MTIKAIETTYNGYKFRSRLEARWAVFFDALGIKYEYEPEGFEFEGGKRYLPDFFIREWDCWVEIKPEIPILSIIKSGLRGGRYSVKKTEYKLCELLAKHTKKPVLLIGGTPWVKRPRPNPDGTIDIDTGVDLYEYKIAVFLPDMIVFDSDGSETGIEVKLPHLQDFGSPFYEDFYESSIHLYGFIYRCYKDFPEYFDKPLPHRGDAFGLIEADKIYFEKMNGRPHWKWEYGIASDDYVFSSSRLNSLELSAAWSYPGERYEILDAYAAARQARFEHGETPNGKS